MCTHATTGRHAGFLNSMIHVGAAACMCCPMRVQLPAVPFNLNCVNLCSIVYVVVADSLAVHDLYARVVSHKAQHQEAVGAHSDSVSGYRRHQGMY